MTIGSVFAAEHGVIGLMRHGRDMDRILMWPRTVPEHLRERPPADAQKSTGATPLSSTERTTSVQGDPGAGKNAMLNSVRAPGR